MNELKIIIHDAEEGGYWAEVQGMPGCYSQGETLAEVRANIREAAEGWVEAKLALALRSPVRDRAAHRGRGASPRRSATATPRPCACHRGKCAWRNTPFQNQPQKVNRQKTNPTTPAQPENDLKR